MFEFDCSKTLRAQENERKPNLYVAAALRIGLGAQLLCLLLNEIGLFHVDKLTMRVCVAIGVLCSLLPQVLVYNDKLATNPKSKYVVLFCTCAMCFIMALALFFFSAPMCLLPMLLAVHYNSERYSRLAVAGSCVCLAVAPPLGCALGLWDTEFFRFLSSAALGGEVVYTLQDATGIMASGPVGVMAFVSFPWLLTALLLGRLILSATRRGEENIQNRIQLTHMNRVDALTGLYNQNVYKEYLRSPVGEETVGVLFFDVDGLKSTNDAQGHELGDLLLRRCAESLHPLFDDACHGFRVGGDEFLVVVDTSDPDLVEEKAEQWRWEMERINRENKTRYPGLTCHMSMGTCFGPKCELTALVAKADKRMYREKMAYHKSIGVPEGQRC